MRAIKLANKARRNRDMICDVHAHYLPRSDYMGHIPASRSRCDYPVLQDYESYTETFAYFAYIERLGLPKSVTDKVLHHNAQKLFGFEH
jgi:hypothetical protein